MWDWITVFSLVVSLTAGFGAASLWIIRRRKGTPRGFQVTEPDLKVQPTAENTSARTAFLHRPTSWLTARSRSIAAVQNALGLNNPKLCTWTEGISSEEKLFIAPPFNGWVLIIGSALPDPADDIDACFRFIADLSRKLGQVEFFTANRALGHHAWVHAEAGRIVRAYAWADQTLWNQGVKTRAEIELGMKCYQYFDAPESWVFGQHEIITSNTEKVPLLAASWSLDPIAIDERVFEHAYGIAGEPPRRY